MIHDKPEPPDMQGHAVTLRQKIQERMDELDVDIEAAIAAGGKLEKRLTDWCHGGLHALKIVVEWLDEQDITT